MNKKKTILLYLFVLTVLAFSFNFGDNEAKINKNISESKNTLNTVERTNSFDKELGSNEDNLLESSLSAEKSTEKDKYQADSLADAKNKTSEEEKSEIKHRELTCTLSVRCDTILNNISHFDKNKLNIIPKDGVIFAEKAVTFYEGESVFNLLAREMKSNKIHFEFEKAPVYNSVYIEGIANIYEFDCGELSGWMYKVNDWFPNYGCSRYKLKEGDRVEVIYTCNLGADVGGDYAANRN